MEVGEDEGEVVRSGGGGGQRGGRRSSQRPAMVGGVEVVELEDRGGSRHQEVARERWEQYIRVAASTMRKNMLSRRQLRGIRCCGSDGEGGWILATQI